MFDEIPQRLGVEFMAGDLSLKLPILAVGVEDSGAEEVREGGYERAALLVDGKTGLEDVLYGGGVAGEDCGAA